MTRKTIARARRWAKVRSASLLVVVTVAIGSASVRAEKASDVDRWLGWPFPEDEKVELLAVDVGARTLTYRIRDAQRSDDLGLVGVATFRTIEVDLATSKERETGKCTLKWSVEENAEVAWRACTAMTGRLRGPSAQPTPTVALSGFGDPRVEATGKHGTHVVTLTLDGEPDVYARLSLTWASQVRGRIIAARFSAFGMPQVSARAFCTDAGCALFVVERGRQFRGYSATGARALFMASTGVPSFDSVALARVCTGGRTAAVVANRALVATRATALVEALRRAGCETSAATAAQKERASDVIYSRPAVTGDGAVNAVAFTLDAEVAPIDWETPAEIVFALGG